MSGTGSNTNWVFGFLYLTMCLISLGIVGFSLGRVAAGNGDRMGGRGRREGWDWSEWVATIWRAAESSRFARF